MNPIALAIIIVGFPLSLIGFLLTRAYCRASSKGYVSVHNEIKIDGIGADAKAVIAAAGVATARGGASAAHAIRFANIASLPR
jgi:hypothetical protein